VGSTAIYRAVLGSGLYDSAV